MPLQTIFALGESQITVSGGGQLSGETQGDGSHLNGLTITLNSNAWEGIVIDDNDDNFADNDGSQRLEGAQTFDGVTYDDNRIVESEYSITVQDSSGQLYTLYAFNIREPNSSFPIFGTIEGLAFLDSSAGGSPFPPIGEPLTVVSTGEGPSTPFSTLATPPCFTPGTMIETPQGPCDIDALRVGDLVNTLDHGPQPIRWVGRASLPSTVLRHTARFRPVEIAAGTFGPGQPMKALRVSPQHRILITGWLAQLYFGLDEVLAPARHLCNGKTIRVCNAVDDVTYIHLLFDQHEILWSNGMLSESYFPGAAEETLIADELRSLFPRLAVGERPFELARPCIQDRSVHLLSGRRA